ncbi:PEP-CTERM sorting domain-containing protein [Nitrosovibrio tenuis]|uniref:PEP-CTERM protein-sorting domain-containing protein n=1 Tax=Nitrosovibrio tenuis TaxID=1233 RepID=A0A1H7QY36_9PROT|nr:PEP-CTERM sorting domain-containing protein [Nitrosovibrio tenuis]SEL52638.1 PEP-CTERM protein-sorting domain-containing protein [Nitrosovibrio tenuis]
MNSLSKLIITALAFGGSISTASAAGVVTDITASVGRLGLDVHGDTTASNVLNLSKTLNSLDPVTPVVTVGHTDGGSNYAVTENSINLPGQEWTNLHLPIKEPTIGVQGNVSASHNQSTLTDITLDSSIGSRNIDFTGALTASAAPAATFNLSLDDAGFRNASAVTLKQVPAIPEPETYAMLLAGLGLMGFIVKRRSKSTV